MSVIRKNCAIVLSGGMGSRSGAEIPKQFLKLAGQTILEHCLEVFQKHANIDEIIVVCHPDYLSLCRKIVKNGEFSKVTNVVASGKTRQESSYIGLSYVSSEDLVLIHDSARPFVNASIISNCLSELQKFDAIDVAIAVKDTLVQVDGELKITHIPNRREYMSGQTPQGFKASLIQGAHKKAIEASDLDNTDDCTLIMKYSPVPIKVVQGDEFNTKITTPVDVSLADRLFQMKSVRNIPDALSKVKNKVVIVFGASSGIGACIVDLLGQKQAKVYGFSRSQGVDVANYDSVTRAIKEVAKKEGRIDVVIVSAGVLYRERFASRDIADISKEVSANYLGNIHVAHMAYSHLKLSKGALIFFGSSSYTRGRASYATYSSVKAALVNFTQALAEEWHDEGIRVNIMNPARTQTPMREQAFGKEPEGTLLDPIDVAKETINVCMSDMTGQVVDVTVSSIQHNKQFL